MSLTDKESRLVAAGRGKWSIAGVPRGRWSCVDIEDLGEASLVCEMCESQIIRYVHHMRHDDYPTPLSVGCICAGHMEDDLAAAQSREASMKSRASKRKKWLSRRWRISGFGNEFLDSDGYEVTVYPTGIGWGATLAGINNAYVRHSKKTYDTKDAAKLAAFDVVSILVARSG